MLPGDQKKVASTWLLPHPVLGNNLEVVVRTLKVLESGWPSLTGGVKRQRIHRPVENLAPRCSELQQPEEAGADDVPPQRASSHAPESIPTQEGRLQGCAVWRIMLTSAGAFTCSFRYACFLASLSLRFWVLPTSQPE